MKVVELQPKAREGRDETAPLGVLEEIKEDVVERKAVGFVAVVLFEDDSTEIKGGFAQRVSRLKLRGMMHTLGNGVGEDDA